MLYRSLTGLGLIVVFMLIARRWREVGFGHLPLMTLRNLVHFGGQNLWLYALMVLPLAQVFALEFTTPIWVLLLAPVILGEPITRRGAVATALGFVGILVVARPGATLDPALIAALGRSTVLCRHEPDDAAIDAQRDSAVDPVLAASDAGRVRADRHRLGR